MKVIVSGGFDPLHIGHIRLLTEAAKYGQVFVILNSDIWLVRKKRYFFMPFEQRSEILMNLQSVVRVYPVNDDDDTVCAALEQIRSEVRNDPLIFCNGGDRTTGLPKESATCEKLGILEAVNVGGGKIESSSQLVEAVRSL